MTITSSGEGVLSPRTYDQIEQHWLTKDFLLLSEPATYPRPTTGGEGAHWWLLQRGVTVAYGKTSLWLDEGAEGFTLSDVEVRQAYRRQGHLRRLIYGIEEVAGRRLYSTGNWTELGAKALHFMPLAKGYEPGVYYKAQNFVKDWEQLLPYYR